MVFCFLKRFKAFKLEPKKRVRKIFIVETKKRLFISETKDTALKIKINSFALENSELKLTKELSFVYPRSDLIK